MKKILVFGASNSKASINKQFATFAANQLSDINVNLIDLNDFDMPIFSVDLEKESGIPEAAQRFKKMIQEADGILISFAEHNGSYSTAFKNLFDWTSRVAKEMWENKPMLLLATSPGGRGGKTVLETAVSRFGHMSGKVVGHFSLPSFYDNFDAENGLKDAEMKAELLTQLDAFKNSL